MKDSKLKKSWNTLKIKKKKNLKNQKIGKLEN